MGPKLWDSVLGQLAAVALLPGYCPISPALQMWAGQQLDNSKLSLPLASPILPDPQVRKTPHVRSSHCSFLTSSVCTRSSAEQLHEKRAVCMTPDTVSSTQEEHLKEQFERDLRHLALFAVLQC